MLAWEFKKGEIPITSSCGMKFRYLGNKVCVLLVTTVEFLVEERIWKYHVLNLLCTSPVLGQKFLVCIDSNIVPRLCF